VRSQRTLLALVRQRRIHRELIDGQFVYFAASPEMQRKQHLARLKVRPRLGAEGLDLLAHEVRAAILLFVSLLDEKQRRLYAGLESLRIGAAATPRSPAYLILTSIRSQKAAPTAGSRS